MTLLAAAQRTVPTVRARAIPVQGGPHGCPSTVLSMLAAGIPLTLLMDLAAPAGPDSRAILGDELRQARRSRSVPS